MDKIKFYIKFLSENQMMVLLWIGSLGFISFNLGEPSTVSFDESLYVPAARFFLSLEKYHVHDHPPLGQFFITLGTYIFGDNPIGWRIFSVIFGSFTIVAIYKWSLLLFAKRKYALLAVIFVFFSQVHLVESRIAKLDIFMTCFIFWSCYFLSKFFFK
jgi:dolichyl-phosphate-mannose-protein mannosyltransferase